MNILYLLLPIALFMGLGSLVVFLWCTINGQYEDLETPAVRILFDDEERKIK